MIGTFLRDRSGKIENPVSLYAPPQDVRDLISKVQQDYMVGHDILNKSWTEFNDRSVKEIMNDDQRAFNSYIEPRSQDPDESWRAQTVRPITRNKIISIAAHVTAALLFPNIFAQNDDDEEDKEAASVMKDIMEWIVDNSTYEKSFLFGIISALVNPAVIMKAEFAEVMQTIRERSADGTITKKEVLDDVLSGFMVNIVPVEELLITNIYEHEIQKQRALCRRRFVDYEEVRSLYGDYADFQYVRPGVKMIFNSEDSMFYEQYDEENPTIVEEVTYYNRKEDLELVFVNGILVSEKDSPMTHRDYMNRPKYPFAKSGFEPVDEGRFFYYKSAVSKLGPDQELVDTLWNMIQDGTFLSLMPPIAVFGDEDINSSVIMPGKVTSFSKSTTTQNLLPSMNLNAGFNAIQLAENSITESSQDNLRSGVAGDSGRTAFEISRLERNAQIQLGLFGKMIGQLVKDFGYLMINNIIHHITVGQVDEITAGITRMKFKTLLLPEKDSGGKKVSKKLQFTDEFFGQMMGQDQLIEQSFSLMDKEGGYDSDTRIYKINPKMFRRLKFLLRVNPDDITPKNENFERVMKLEGYDRMIANPFVDQEAVTRDYLVSVFAKGETAKYMKKQPLQPQPQEQQEQPKSKTSALIPNVMQSNVFGGTMTE